MRVEVTEDEVREISSAMVLASEHPKAMSVNWEIISRFIAKLDRPMGVRMTRRFPKVFSPNDSRREHSKRHRQAMRKKKQRSMKKMRGKG